MSRRRFYAPPENISGSSITLPKGESHHLVRVLRLKGGDEAFVFDGRGNEYRCAIIDAIPSGSSLEIIEPQTNAVESPLTLILGQALAKAEKFDFIVQKATELGVSRIWPLATEFSEIRLDPEQASKRVARWKRISLEALKQCGRRRLVEISEPMTIGELCAAPPSGNSDLHLVFSEKGGAAITDTFKELKPPAALTAFIGPEGGWSDPELALLDASGVRSVSLGPRILRTETAAVVAITLIQHLFGDLSRQRTDER